MEGGGSPAAGRKRSRAASTSCRSRSKKPGSVIGEFWGEAGIGPASRGFGLAFGFEGFGDEPAVSFLEKDFDFAFSFLELLLAFGRKPDTFFEEFHRIVEGKLRALEFADYFFKAREAALEVGLFGRFGFLWSLRIHAAFSLSPGNFIQTEVSATEA